MRCRSRKWDWVAIPVPPCGACHCQMPCMPCTTGMRSAEAMGWRGETQPMATAAPRAAFRPWGPPTERLGGVTPGRNAQSFVSERRPTRRRRPRDAGSTTNNPWLPMGGQRPPLIYATRGLRDYSRSTSARRLFRSPVRVGGGEWVTADGTPNPKLSAVPRLGGSLPVVGPSLQTGLPGVAAALGWCP